MTPRISSLVTIAMILLADVLLAPQAWARRSGPPRNVPIDMIVIHSTGGPTCDAATGQPVWIKAGTLDDDLRIIEAHPVLGIHHVVGRDGTVRSSVPEDQVAYHVFTYSQRSIGIELINDGDGVDPFPEAQLHAVTALIRDIARRHGIPRERVRRHSDLDRGRMECDKDRRRKVDPGAAFPFEAVLAGAFAVQILP